MIADAEGVQADEGVSWLRSARRGLRADRAGIAAHPGAGQWRSEKGHHISANGTEVTRSYESTFTYNNTIE